MKNTCNGCGLCCKLFYINLSKVEYESDKYQTIFRDIYKDTNYVKARECGAIFLDKKENEECIYLINNKCSIHDRRPVVCRNFYCSSKSKKFEKMRRIIEEARNL